jgi:FtsH-binding integral membrane protein
MENQQPIQTTYIGTADVSSVRTFLANVFSYMALALTLSGVMAWWFGHSPELMAKLYTIDFLAGTAELNILGWVVMLAPLGLVFAMGGLLNRLSGQMLLLLFIAYSVINGISLSFIFLTYTETAITRVFFMAAGLFSIMAFAGYTTRTDLSKLGSILMIGLIGIVVASLINMFIGSSSMDYIISIIGVIIFTGLTAYDMQRLKQMGEVVATGTETAQKMSLMGALSLYLNFINLFLMLLRLFGRRD